METPANFEEKEFESAVNDEFVTIFHPAISPGQVLENWIGFDRALFIPYWHPIWRARFGIEDHMLLSELNDTLVNLDRAMPHFKVNLFLQYKRPVEVTPKMDSIKYYGESKYFKYNLDLDQAQTLRNLNARLNGSAKIYYCAPAFICRTELHRMQAMRRVRQHSNFTEIGKVKHDHEKITFTESGFKSVGRSDPELFDSENFNELSDSNSFVFSETFRRTVSILSDFAIEHYSLTHEKSTDSLIERMRLSGILLSDLNLRWNML